MYIYIYIHESSVNVKALNDEYLLDGLFDDYCTEFSSHIVLNRLRGSLIRLAGQHHSRDGKYVLDWLKYLERFY